MDTNVALCPKYKLKRPLTFPFDRCRIKNMELLHTSESVRTVKSPVYRYNIINLEFPQMFESRRTLKYPLYGYNENNSQRVNEDWKVPGIFRRKSTTFSDRRYLEFHMTENERTLKSPLYRFNEKTSLPILSEFLNFREMIVRNWILVKDNSSPFSWWKQMKEIHFLSNSELEDLDKKTTNIERRDLAELLLIKALQEDVCTNGKQIEVLKKIILKGIENKLIQKKREHAQTESDDKNLYDFFKQNSKEWEKCLNRQEVIQIKDHLLQDDFITFKDNEGLVNDDNYYKRSKEHLFSQIVQKVDEGLGSFQCFIRHATTIIGQKQSGKKILQKFTRHPHNKAKRSVSITKKDESVAVRYTHKGILGQQQKMTIKIKDEKEKEATEAYEYMEKNPDLVEKVFFEKRRAKCDDISLGSIVIHYHPLDRKTSCTFDDGNENLIHQLLQEVILKSKIPSGKYTLTAEVHVTNNLNTTVSEFKPLTDEINFMTAEESFLVEEMDIDAVFAGFKKRNITIESIQTECRKDIAKELLNAIIKHHLEDDFINILREYEMSNILHRYETYLNVYRSETAVLRRNIINNVSSIIQCIDIEDILQEVLLNRHVINEKTLNELVFKFENRKDAIASLIIELLKSGNAIHAFAYALFLQENNPLLINNSPQDGQGISDHDEEYEIGTYPEEDSLPMYSGCFNITIGDEDVREKRSQFPLSPSNIDFPYQHLKAGTNYGMMYNKSGVRALSPSTGQFNDDERDIFSRPSYAGSPDRARTTIIDIACSTNRPITTTSNRQDNDNQGKILRRFSNRARTTTTNRQYNDYQGDRSSYASSSNRARMTTTKRQDSDYQRERFSLSPYTSSSYRARTTTANRKDNDRQRKVVSRSSYAGSPTRPRTTTSNRKDNDRQRKIVSRSSYAGSPTRPRTTTTNNEDNDRQRKIVSRSSYAGSPTRPRTTTTNREVNDRPRKQFSRSPYACSPNRERTLYMNDEDNDRQRKIVSRSSYAGSPTRSRTTTTNREVNDRPRKQFSRSPNACSPNRERTFSMNVPYKESRSEVSSRLSYAGSSNRARTTTTNNVTECDDDVRTLSSNAGLSIITLSLGSITCTTNPGHSTQIEADYDTRSINSPAKTKGTIDSGDSTEFEADDCTQRISSSVSTIGITDSGDSTQLEVDDYTYRMSSFMSNKSTDCGHSIKPERYDDTIRISSSMSSIGKTGAGHSTTHEEDDETHMMSSPMSIIGTMDSGNSTQLEADDETHMINSSVSTIGTTDSGLPTQLEGEDDTYRISLSLIQICTINSGHSTQRESENGTHRIKSNTSTIDTTDSGDSTQLAANSKRQNITSPTSAIGTKDSGYSTQRVANGKAQKISSPAHT